ncbi:PP2C family serine/threonine-protein phosphatase [Allochromatium vinosum]|uniref:Protein serine/threonine phosphatase n=1 Tax=Allochromatium vinosum (strain ATCC 17899 / DSM 180 / NBRC 103801 / NCIMB 10441 / D) TaxID=572477 RepID=D3RV19_ALLVD|nr:PP2C family serine/threonine-protein phosphatase [Allochromatium vinosum]ADC62951.1 protein serine/threonine phosphatase [Allochromatium vinosum DSM 180]MBK1656561.1 protein phosphatase 2C domain-containing protein [Allochromatium vinosum]
MAWRWASASVIGTSHIQNGDRLQDAYAVSELGNGYIFAVVSDGAGSAKFGAFGAWLVCRFLIVRFREWILENPELPTDEDLSGWIDELRDRISTIATRRDTVPREFAATLAAIVLAPDEAVTLHIGDSAIVGRKGCEWDVLCWPDNGEYASSTYFVTDAPEPRLNILRHPREYNAFALFSDGVGDLALSHLERVAYTRFFDPMMRPVETASGEGRLVDLSAKLAAYLASPSVCDRTDDDKTIILISGG